MAPKSKLILIMAALSLRKKKICVLALLVMFVKVNNEDTGKRFWVRKIFQGRKKYGLYHILTDELRLFDKEYYLFFPFFQILFFKFTNKNVYFNNMQLKLILFLLLTGKNFSGNKLQQNWQEFSWNVHSNLFHLLRLTTKYQKKLISGARLTIVP